MDQAVVKRIKRVWGVAWVCGTCLVLVGWGVKAAAVAALAFVGVSFLAVVVFFLYLLLGDTPVALQVLMIALFLVGLVVELGALVAALRWGGMSGWG
jgi:hypothetical protein